MDAVDEFYSPYVYVGNNPLLFLDPNGMNKNIGISSFFFDPLAKAKYELGVAWNALDKFTNNVIDSWALGQKENAKAASVVLAMVAEKGMPDKISYSGNIATAPGKSHELGLAWLTNGPEGSFIPNAFYTEDYTVGLGAEALFNTTLSWYLQDKSKMRHDAIRGPHSYISAGEGNISGTLGYGYDSQGEPLWIDATFSTGLNFGTPMIGKGETSLIWSQYED